MAALLMLAGACGVERGLAFVRGRTHIDFDDRGRGGARIVVPLGDGHHAIYSDGKNARDPDYCGGNNLGTTDPDGVWKDTWEIAATAPPGRVDVDVVGSSWETFDPTRERTSPSPTSPAAAGDVYPWGIPSISKTRAGEIRGSGFCAQSPDRGSNLAVAVRNVTPTSVTPHFTPGVVMVLTRQK